MSPRPAILEPPNLDVLVPMTVEDFLAFTETRPDDEKWELIEGRPILQASATKAHQIIANNIGGFLWFEQQRLLATWLPLQGVGTIVPVAPGSLPQPDVMVLENATDLDAYASTTDDALVLFEIISKSNTKADQAWRQRVYPSIPNCQHYVTVHQRRVEVVRYDRAAGWKPIRLKTVDATLELAALGVRLPVAAIYARTPAGAPRRVR